MSSSIVIVSRPLAPPPDELRRVQFWLYLLDLGYTRADILSAIAGYVTAGDLTQAEGARMEIKVNDAEVYERLDPDLLRMANLLELADDQDGLDYHFREAVAP